MAATNATTQTFPLAKRFAAHDSSDHSDRVCASRSKKSDNRFISKKSDNRFISKKSENHLLEVSSTIFERFTDIHCTEGTNMSSTSKRHSTNLNAMGDCRNMGTITTTKSTAISKDEPKKDKSQNEASSNEGKSTKQSTREDHECGTSECGKSECGTSEIRNNSAYKKNNIMDKHSKKKISCSETNHSTISDTLFNDALNYSLSMNSIILNDSINSNSTLKNSLNPITSVPAMVGRATRRQQDLERRAKRAQRRLLRLQARQAQAHVSEQLRSFIDLQHQQLVSLAADPATTSVLQSGTMKNMSTASLVKLVQRIQQHTTTGALLRQNLSSKGESVVKLDSESCVELLRVSSTLSSSLHHVEQTIDSDATESDSGDESIDEQEEEKKTDM